MIRPKFKRFTRILIACFVLSNILSCKKYLDASPDKQLTTPDVEQDLRAILDNSRIMNSNYSVYGAIASDNYYIKDINYQSLYDPVSGDYYIWGLNGEPTDNYGDWEYNYTRIFDANVVLDNIDKVKLNGATQSDLNSAKEEALFYRAFSHFQLSQAYALPYNPSTAANTLGVPLRLTPDINVTVTRPTLKDEFASIVSDLQQAINLLPNINATKLRPSKPAAYAALANVFLVMQDFVNAEKAADSALDINDSLIDYNNISSSIAAPFPLFNSEVLWQADIGSAYILSSSNAKADSIFYKSFSPNDLRKHLYFDSSNGQAYKGYYNGKYNGSEAYFAGMAVDEVYLVKAEAAARNGDIASAMSALNILAKYRYAKESFTSFIATDKESALKIILDMRRKELCFRGLLRWMDIRRLNQISGEQEILKRTLLGESYSLEPNDLHYAFLIPQEIIDNSHIEQNKR